MPVTSYFAQTGAKLSDRAANETLRDAIIAAGFVPVRDGALLFAQDTFPRLLEQYLIIALSNRGWASGARAVVGAASILAASDDGVFVDQDVTAGNALANLPQASTVRQGFNFTLRKSDVSLNTITLTPFLGDTITGPTVIGAQFDALMVVRTATEAWATIAI